MEPQWTKSISSELICNSFYAYFIFSVFIGLVSLIGMVTAIMKMKGLGGAKLAVFIGIGLLTFLLIKGIELAFILFAYLICDRSLIAKTA